MKSAGLPTTSLQAATSFCTELKTLKTDGNLNKKRPDTFSFLQQYCLWNEEIMVMVFNKAVNEELNSFDREEASND